MSKTISAASSGKFNIGGDIEVNRLGFGAMRVTGKGIWGDHPDPPGMLKLLARVPGLGINLIDTADSYGPYVSEDMVRKAYHPYKDLLVSTKGGFTRHGPGVPNFVPLGRPEYLRQCVLMSLRRLGLERIDLWYLHRIDPTVPHADQFGVIADMQKEGLIRHAGISEGSVDDIKEANTYFKVAAVQNRYNFADREHEAVLQYCEAQGMAFVPWYPLAGGELLDKPGSILSTIAEKHGASKPQVALAWLLRRSPVILPIPGTDRINELEENAAAGDIELSDEDFEALSKTTSTN